MGSLNFYRSILFILLISFGVTAQKSNTPRTYITYKTNQPLKIDGLDSEDAWQKATWSQDFIDIEGKKIPEFKTNLKMLWDEQYLYFFAKLEEPHVWATLKQRDTVIFYNNDFEIFIDPDGDSHNYMELEMNALNTIWDLFIVKPYREPAPIIDNWDINGLKSAVNINGTLNDPSDTDKGWSVEIAIPWAALNEANPHNRIPKDEFWRINFSRVNWDFQLKNGTYSRKKDSSGNFLPEYNWVWSPQGIINMHEPEHWGYVYFSPKVVGQKDSFNIPQDEKIKWFLYKLYRNQKSFHNENGKWATKIEDILSQRVQIEGKKIEPELENHRSGWNISAVSPFTNSIYIIKEDGDLIKIK
ncbi:carbohydrate-binding family 9-like protein [Gramella jeungdoensis]|uniref:Carbohydrate-binding family 9-like protein n=1 Tax=Gramella jeungdoensis TaxID=708091 RepID=A0ABT0Z5B0_9FLAO|nr:carbohydrate-binding family 9-like protein [Gramella jeungdoensis]MCM8570905.1 carbohydrate-binding family 9-like protein [Gramella jeungdoensis]